MKRLVWDQRERVSEWVRERMPYRHSAWERLYQAIGLEAGDEIVAGVVLYDYRPGASITMSVAAEPKRLWAYRHVLSAAFVYAFVQCDVRRITAYVAERNWRCRRLVERLGFELEGTMRQALPDGSAELVYGLMRENYGR